ncbi:recombinase family protein [Arthrobacter ginkgonis]|uniref:recombinase family protein n=1 Tax=Arthrobacter ginkgonis TaxID=1630594 RepID=UPI0031E7035C
MTDNRLRAVLYLRLSAVSDDSTSLDRQERDLREHAGRKGWHVTEVLVDEGISGRKARAKAAEAVRMIADDEADVLAVWKLDRFTRMGYDGLGALSQALATRAEGAKAGRCIPALFVALHDGLNSNQAAFRMIAGVLSEVARSEAENAAARIANSIEHRKTRTHKFAGGSAVPLGYRSVPAPDGTGRILVHDDEEVALIRDVAARILSNIESLTGIAADLNKRGVPTSRSLARRALRQGLPAEGLDTGKWTVSTFRNVWTSDVLLGRVVHRGKFVSDAAGIPLAVWPPILDRSTLDALRVRMNWKPRKDQRGPLGLPPAPKPKVQPTRKRAARILSSVAFCGLCDSRLYVTTTSGTPIYKCGSSWNGEKCPSPSITADALDEYVAARVLAVAGEWPEMATETIASGGAPEATLAEIEALLREASVAMTEDDAQVPELLERIAGLKARRADLRARPVTVETVSKPTGRTLAEAWDADEGTAWRRSVLLWAIDHVRVGPRTPGMGTRAFDEDRVAIYWNS